MFYQFKVPPTNDVGSYSGTCSNRYGSHRADCLSQYNSCRAHDGLPPVARMPAGTSYTPVVEFVVQGYYAEGWEDLTAHFTRKDARDERKVYQENEPGQYRIVRRPIKADELQHHLRCLGESKREAAAPVA